MIATLYGVGSNSHGQLGIDSNGQDIRSPRAIPLPQAFVPKRITGGANHTLFTDGVHVYSCGDNKCGQLGRPTKNDHDPTILPIPASSFAPSTCIIDVAAGWDFSLVLVRHLTSTLLFGFGSSQYGILEQMSTHPVLISSIPFSQIACGVRHALALSHDRRTLYAWGDTRHGKLGPNSSKNRLVSSPTPFWTHDEIISIAAGHQHSAVLTSQGAVYIFGRTKYGLQPIIYLSDAKEFAWHSIYSSWHSIYVLGRSASFYLALGWGRNDSHQVSGDSSHEISTPTPRPNVIQIACGSEHVLLLNSDNAISSLGWNEHGNCNLDLKATLIGCGYAHSFCIAHDNLYCNA